jgi:hypothetical protein
VVAAAATGVLRLCQRLLPYKPDAAEPLLRGLQLVPGLAPEVRGRGRLMRDVHTRQAMPATRAERPGGRAGPGRWGSLMLCAAHAAAARVVACGARACGGWTAPPQPGVARRLAAGPPSSCDSLPTLTCAPVSFSHTVTHLHTHARSHAHTHTHT